MEIFGWTISRREIDSLPTLQLVVTGIVVAAIAYPLGYLMIDVLHWISLTPEQSRDVYVCRVITGLLVMAPPGIGFMLWENWRND